MDKDSILKEIGSAPDGEWKPTESLTFSRDSDGSIRVRVKVESGEVPLSAFLLDICKDLDFYITTSPYITTWFEYTKAVMELAKFLGVDMGANPMSVPEVEIPEELPKHAEPESKPENTAYDPDKEFFRGKWAALNEILTGRKVTLE